MWNATSSLFIIGSSRTSVSVIIVTTLVSVSNPAPATFRLFATTMSRFFFCQLLSGILQHIFRFHREAAEELTGSFMFSKIFLCLRCNIKIFQPSGFLLIEYYSCKITEFLNFTPSKFLNITFLSPVRQENRNARFNTGYLHGVEASFLTSSSVRYSLLTSAALKPSMPRRD